MGRAADRQLGPGVAVRGGVLPGLVFGLPRAREYSCDRHGFHACTELASAQAGLATLEQAGYALIDPGHAVQTFEVDAGNGVVRVYPSDMRYRGGALAFTPRVDENRRVLWRCSGEDLLAAVLPPDCRD